MPRNPIFPVYKNLSEIAEIEHENLLTPLFTVVGNRGQISEHTLADLRDGARRWGKALAEVIEPGDRVMLCMPTSIEIMQAFFGVLMAGGVAVPIPYAFTKKPEYLDDYLRTRQSVVDDSGASAMVTHPDLRDVSETLAERCESLTHIVTVEDLPDTADGFERVDADADDVALLQYTSGSTGQPKGVVLTHGCLLWNLQGIGEALRPEEQGDGVVSWLPLYHDMGLIGGWLYPLSSRLRHVVMATEVFLADPTFWLQAMAQIKATITVAPNFGYALAVKRVKPEMVKMLDLSRLRTCLCGAEPIDARVMAAFQDKFTPAGLQPNALLPVYGLAEATLAATFTSIYEPVKVKFLDRRRLDEQGEAVEIDSRDEGALQVVCVGTALGDGQIRIADPASGVELPDYRQGEILVRSGSVMKGYFRNEEATAKTLAGGWLHTGDLGFLDGEELYVTGRIKDLIITYGRNFYPHDIEWLTAKIKGVRQGCVAAFGVTNDEDATEEIVVVAETRQTERDALRAMRREIRHVLMSTIECNPKRIVLVPPRAVPKTTSGKIRRVEARQRFLANGFDSLL